MISDELQVGVLYTCILHHEVNGIPGKTTKLATIVAKTFIKMFNYSGADLK